MARSRRDWDALRADVYAILREPEAGSYWTAADMLRFFNHAMDLRMMQLGLAHEGWITVTTDINLVAHQEAYALPVDSGRVKRALIRHVDGNEVQEIPLTRQQNWITSVTHGASLVGYKGGVTPTARLMGANIILEPRPTVSETGGLRLEYEAPSAHFTTGTDTLAANLPIETETLLVYDTALLAIGSEGTQGVDDSVRSEIVDFHMKYERGWMEYTEDRFFGKQQSIPFKLGD